MSLRGRWLIDYFKQRSFLGKYVSLPCPPYHDPSYWEGVYRQFPTNTDDSFFEWGNLSYRDLQTYQYQLLPIRNDLLLGHGNQNDTTTPTTNEPAHAETISTTFEETIKSSSFDTSQTLDDDFFTILMLGCGNSRFGQDILQAEDNQRQQQRQQQTGRPKRILQVDVSSRVMESMTQRCRAYQQAGRMQFIQDDARVLSAFESASRKAPSPDQEETVLRVDAVMDKGLVDALFCSHNDKRSTSSAQQHPCFQVLQSVHRVLQPHGIFCLLSFSQPEFLLPTLLGRDVHNESVSSSSSQWQDIQVRQCDSILLYRFQKAPMIRTEPNLRPRKQGKRSRNKHTKAKKQ